MRLRQSPMQFSSVAPLLILIAMVSPIASWADDASKRVRIVGVGVELVEISPSAEKCANRKGETIHLKVTSESAIDVRLYVLTGWHQWINKDFPNQKKGDEISEYRCAQKTRLHDLFPRRR